MADEQAKVAYTEDDMVSVIDGITGEPMEHPVPKAWIGTDLLPPGSKKASETKVAKANKSAAEGDGGQLTEPAPNAQKKTWVAYAKAQGASDDDLKGLGRDEIRDRYQSSAAGTTTTGGDGSVSSTDLLG